MRQKFQLNRNKKDGVITVIESTEVDSDIIMPLNEEKYNLNEMAKASSEGLDAFKFVLRRRNFFPNHDLSNKLFEETKKFFEDDSQEKIIVEYNDIESVPLEEDFILEDTDVEIDDLLKDDADISEPDEIVEIDSENDKPIFTPEDDI